MFSSYFVSKNKKRNLFHMLCSQDFKENFKHNQNKQGFGFLCDGPISQNLMKITSFIKNTVNFSRDLPELKVIFRQFTTN